MARENYAACLQFTLRYEGGFVNHPRDPGGATNMGITHATLAAWRRCPVSVQDVCDMSRNEAELIYKNNYWDKISGDNLPAGADLVVFDYAVNSGPARALQTMKTAGNPNNDTLQFIGRYSDLRLSFLQGLRTWQVFGRGWGTRVGACEAAALKLATARRTMQPAVLKQAATRVQAKAQRRQAVSASLAISATGGTVAATMPAKNPGEPLPVAPEVAGGALFLTMLAAGISGLFARSQRARADAIAAAAQV